METRFTGRVQSGQGDASHGLSKFNAAYSRKIGAPVFPGSLNLAVASASIVRPGHMKLTGAENLGAYSIALDSVRMFVPAR